VTATLVKLAFAGIRSRLLASALTILLASAAAATIVLRLFARAARHAPLAPRLALRDLARYQARSGAALAAITLALGIAAAVEIVAAAEEKQSAAEPPNLSNRQIRVYTGAMPDPQLVAIQTPTELKRMTGRVRALAGSLDDPGSLTEGR
jgi:putative ABC transport system permease protein